MPNAIGRFGRIGKRSFDLVRHPTSIVTPKHGSGPRRWRAGATCTKATQRTRKHCREHRTNQPFERRKSWTIEPRERRCRTDRSSQPLRTKETRQSTRLTIEQLVAPCSGENDIGPRGLGSRHELDFEERSRPRQRQCIDSANEKLEPMRSIFGTTTNDVAAKMRLKRRKIRPIIARPLEIERNREGRPTTVPLRPSNRERQNRSRVEASTGQHPDTLDSLQRAFHDIVEGMTQQVHAFAFVLRSGLSGLVDVGIDTARSEDLRMFDGYPLVDRGARFERWQLKRTPRESKRIETRAARVDENGESRKFTRPARKDRRPVHDVRAPRAALPQRLARER